MTDWIWRLNKLDENRPEDVCSRDIAFYSHHRVGHDGQDKVLSAQHAVLVFSSLLSLSPYGHQDTTADSTKNSYVHRYSTNCNKKECLGLTPTKIYLEKKLESLLLNFSIDRNWNKKELCIIRAVQKYLECYNKSKKVTVCFSKLLATKSLVLFIKHV